MKTTRTSAAVAGLTIGILGLLSTVAPSKAMADSPWDKVQTDCSATVSPLSINCQLVLTGGNDSPWD